MTDFLKNFLLFLLFRTEENTSEEEAYTVTLPEQVQSQEKTGKGCAYGENRSLSRVSGTCGEALT